MGRQQYELCKNSQRNIVRTSPPIAILRGAKSWRARTVLTGLERRRHSRRCHSNKGNGDYSPDNGPWNMHSEQCHWCILEGQDFVLFKIDAERRHETMSMVMEAPFIINRSSSSVYASVELVSYCSSYSKLPLSSNELLIRASLV